VVVAASYAEPGPSGSPLPAAKPPAASTLDPGLSQFAGVLLGYVVALAALATLSPFDFDFRDPPHGYTWYTSVSDVALNLAFLFPVGFLMRLARAERVWPLCLDALLLGCAISLILESAQAFLPSRVSSPTDVLTNGGGAWLGGIAHSRIGPFLDRRLQKQLSLHLPLANLLYLAVPLLSLDGLSTRRTLDVLPVGLLAWFIAVIAAGLYKHRLEGTATPFPNWFSAAIGCVFAIGYMPLCTRSTQLWAASSLGMVVLTRLTIAFGTRLPSTERRFVPVTIQRALPFFCLYLLAVGARGQLPGWLGLASEQDASVLGGGQVAAIGLLRDVAAFTLLGYVGSELQARSSARLITIFGRMFALALPVALACSVFSLGLQDPGLASRLAILSASAVAGAIIHRSQLRLVRSWSRHSIRPAPAPAVQ
jgi:glycopeptide antibiotics resistance protein